MAKYKIYIILALIIFLGLFLRAYHVNQAPPGIYPDEAVNGIDALNASQTGNYQWFYPANNGREGLFINIMALGFKFFGVSIFTLKLPSIIFGTLAIWGVYLLAAEIFKNKRLGLIAAFLTAVSFWAINFSRIGFRAIMVPAILVFSFYFLFRTLRTKKWWDAAIGGFIFGLGLHTYIAFRIAPLILIVGLIFLIFSYENFLKNYWKQIMLFIILAAISAGPMFYTFFVSHPEYWTSRTSEISILNPAVNQGHLFTTFLKTFGLSLAKYNFWGDQNWRQNYPPYSILDPLTGLAFLFGIIYIIIKFFHLTALRFTKKIRDPKLAAYAILLSTFFAMLIPEFMGAEGNPHALRSIGTLPVVFIFAALTFNYFWEKSKNRTYMHSRIVIGLVILMFVSIGLFNPIKYFVFWANNPKTAQAFEKNITELSFYTKTLSPSTEVYVILGNMQRVPPRLFNWNNPNFHDLNPTEIEKINLQSKNIVFVFSDYDKDFILNKLMSRFPNLNLQEFKDKFGMSFYVLKFTPIK